MPGILYPEMDRALLKHSPGYMRKLVVIGLFGFIILVVATLAVGGIYVARQFAKNPRAMVETIVRHDPNLEIVSEVAALHRLLGGAARNECDGHQRDGRLYGQTSSGS